MNNSINNIPLFATGFFTAPPYDLAPPRLVGGICKKCCKDYFPRPKYCPKCLGIVNEKKMVSKGVIHSFTVVRTKPPMGLPQPYCVGYIDLDESNLRVFCLLDPMTIDQFTIGTKVKLEVGLLGHDNSGIACLRPYFKSDL